MRKLWLVPGLVFIALLTVALGHGGTAQAATIGFTPGWHLVAGPSGTIFPGITSLYSLDPSSGQYVAQPLRQPAQAGTGYFALFSGLINVRMAPDQHDPVSVKLPASAWVLVGNPSSISAATVSGVDVAYVYDQQGGYLVQSSIPPGSGALVYSYFGGTATIRPIPGGVDTEVSGLEDVLIDAAIGPQDVPASFALTRGDASGGQNGNVPVQYIEEFRPRTAPKAADSQQTTLISISIQQAKDADYATLLFNGTTPDQVKQAFGANARSVDQVDPPPAVGDAARLLRVQVVNGNNQTGAYVLAFRRGKMFVTMFVTAPFGREDRVLLTTLAMQQDQRLIAAFPSLSDQGN